MSTMQRLTKEPQIGIEPMTAPLQTARVVAFHSENDSNTTAARGANAGGLPQKLPQTGEQLANGGWCCGAWSYDAGCRCLGGAA